MTNKELLETILQRLDEIESRLSFFESENVVERLENLDHVDIDALCDRVANIERLIEDNAPPDEEDVDIEEYLASIDIPIKLHESELFGREIGD